MLLTHTLVRWNIVMLLLFSDQYKMKNYLQIQVRSTETLNCNSKSLIFNKIQVPTTYKEWYFEIVNAVNESVYHLQKHSDKQAVLDFKNTYNKYIHHPHVVSSSSLPLLRDAGRELPP